jgi:hypothetical protein
MLLYPCRCGAPLFFANTRCLACGAPVGYDPEDDAMRVPDDGPPPRRLCTNGVQYSVCNWLTAGEDPELCVSCRLNRMIPDLSQPGTQELWHKVEFAKRRMLHWLLRRELPAASRAEDPRGLTFDLLLPSPQHNVVSGHEAGLITLNVQEADDAARERNRAQLHEPYRTLLGHFRHEIAHYYWWLWLDAAGGTRLSVLPGVRELFGDDRADYGESMQRYYAQGPPPDWPQHYISAYASMHPWEDWAETWAHYMHITDALETARATSLVRTGTRRHAIPHAADLSLPESFARPKGHDFREIITAWMHLAPALNEMSLSLGHGDLYPFTPAPQVLKKLYCIHWMVGGG